MTTMYENLYKISKFAILGLIQHAQAKLVPKTLNKEDFKAFGAVLTEKRLWIQN